MDALPALPAALAQPTVCEGLGRLHRRRPSAGAAADHRAPAATRPRGRDHRPRATGRPRACSTARDPLYESSAPTAAPRRPARRGRWDRAARASGAGPAASASTWRSPTARSTSRSSRALLADPAGADERLRARRAAAADLASARRSRVLAPDAIPVEAMEKAGARRGAAVPLPGPEGGLLPRRLRARPRRAGRARRSTGVRASTRSSLRPPPETSEYHARQPALRGRARPARGEPDARDVVIPRTEGQGEAARGGGSAALIVPDRAIDAQSLIAYADLVVSAGGTMNREAVALGTPVYTIFSRRAGGRRREADRRGPAAAARRPGRRWCSRSATHRARRPPTPRDPEAT